MHSSCINQHIGHNHFLGELSSSYIPYIVFILYFLLSIDCFTGFFILRYVLAHLRLQYNVFLRLLTISSKHILQFAIYILIYKNTPYSCKECSWGSLLVAPYFHELTARVFLYLPMDRSDVSIITISFLFASEKADITACSTKPTLQGKFVPNQWLVYYSYLCYYIKAIFSGICRFYRRTRRLVSGQFLLTPLRTLDLIPLHPSKQV